MKQTYEDDLTKALRCLGSQNAEGDCYEDSENMRRWESGEKLLMCAENPVGKERCPYHQPTYSCCFEGGECMEWLGKAADEIVSQDINILDYTVMAALKDCLERQVEK